MGKDTDQGGFSFNPDDFENTGRRRDDDAVFEKAMDVESAFSQAEQKSSDDADLSQADSDDEEACHFNLNCPYCQAELVFAFFEKDEIELICPECTYKEIINVDTRKVETSWSTEDKDAIRALAQQAKDRKCPVCSLAGNLQSALDGEGGKIFRCWYHPDCAYEVEYQIDLKRIEERWEIDEKEASRLKKMAAHLLPEAAEEADDLKENMESDQLNDEIESADNSDDQSSGKSFLEKLREKVRASESKVVHCAGCDTEFLAKDPEVGLSLNCKNCHIIIEIIDIDTENNYWQTRVLSAKDISGRVYEKVDDQKENYDFDRSAQSEQVQRKSLNERMNMIKETKRVCCAVCNHYFSLNNPRLLSQVKCPNCHADLSIVSLDYNEKYWKTKQIQLKEPAQSLHSAAPETKPDSFDDESRGEPEPEPEPDKVCFSAGPGALPLRKSAAASHTRFEDSRQPDPPRKKDDDKPKSTVHAPPIQGAPPAEVKVWQQRPAEFEQPEEDDDDSYFSGDISLKALYVMLSVVVTGLIVLVFFMILHKSELNRLSENVRENKLAMAKMDDKIKSNVSIELQKAIADCGENQECKKMLENQINRLMPSELNLAKADQDKLIQLIRTEQAKIKKDLSAQLAFLGSQNKKKLRSLGLRLALLDTYIEEVQRQLVYYVNNLSKSQYHDQRFSRYWIRKLQKQLSDFQKSLAAYKSDLDRLKKSQQALADSTRKIRKSQASVSTDQTQTRAGLQKKSRDLPIIIVEKRIKSSGKKPKRNRSRTVTERRGHPGNTRDFKPKVRADAQPLYVRGTASGWHNGVYYSQQCVGNGCEIIIY